MLNLKTIAGLTFGFGLLFTGFTLPASAGGTFTQGGSETHLNGTVNQWKNSTTTTVGTQTSTGTTDLTQWDCDKFLVEHDQFSNVVNSTKVETAGSTMSGTLIENSWTRTNGFIPYTGPMGQPSN